jgi:tetratricopeptide (TPR) repeat protein
MRELSFVVILILLMSGHVVMGEEMAADRANEIDKRRIIRGVVKNWVEIGAKQYERGLYEHARKSLFKALEYEHYLTAAEYTKINKLLKSTSTTSLGREHLTEYIQAAKELIEKGELLKAKAYLERIKESDSLTKNERRKVGESLNKLYKQIKKQQKEISELYKRSVEFYGKGQLEKAREGFVKVARSKVSGAPEGEMAEDYLIQIDAILQNEAKSKEIKKEGMPAKIAAAEPVKKQDRQIEVGSRSKNIQHSYTKAVVEDAVNKAQNYMSQGKFYKAQETVEKAVKLVNENRIYLGDDLFTQYSQQLKELIEAISKERKKWLGDLQGIEDDKR